MRNMMKSQTMQPQPITLSRREFLRLSALFAGGTLLSACGIRRAVTPTPAIAALVAQETPRVAGGGFTVAFQAGGFDSARKYMGGTEAFRGRFFQNVL
jgi:hypothetical protein